MARQALQAQFTRLIWWIMFVGTGSSLLLYAFMPDSGPWWDRNLTHITGMLVWMILCRTVFWRRAEIGAGVAMAGVIVVTPLLISSGDFNTSFATLAISSLPTLFVAMLWGWRGSLLTLLLSIPVLIFKPGTLEQAVVGWTILAGTAFSGSLVHRLIGDVDRTQAQLKTMALTDPLTKLGNRFALETDFPVLNGAGLLCMWDVNGLKRVNDRLGHHAGDAHLLKFVAAFKAQAIITETLYRVGGDEFVSLHHPTANLRDLLERVRDSFPDISAGWAALENRELDSVMKEADRAMYADKGKRLNITGH